MKYAFTHGKLLDGTKDMQVPHMMADQSVFREPGRTYGRVGRRGRALYS